MNLSQMLQRMNDSGHAVAVEKHSPCNRPVGPLPIRRSSDNSTPGVEISSAVIRMQEWDWEAHQIDVLAAHLVLLARAILDDPWWNWRSLAGGRQCFYNLPARCILWKAQRNRHLAKVQPRLATGCCRRSECPKTRLNSLNTGK